MDLGHLLTLSDLTHPEVYSMVFPDSIIIIIIIIIINRGPPSNLTHEVKASEFCS